MTFEQLIRNRIVTDLESYMADMNSYEDEALRSELSIEERVQDFYMHAVRINDVTGR